MTDEKMDKILFAALSPIIEEDALTLKHQKGNPMKKNLKMTLLAAALCVLLATTAFAAGLGNITSLVSHSFIGNQYSKYSELPKVQKNAGFEFRAPDELPDGFRFDCMEVMDVDGLDENDAKQMTYKEVCITYQNNAGIRVFLTAYPDSTGIPVSAETDVYAKTWEENGITLQYKVDHYKYVPPDYERTAEDEENLRKPNYNISYGSDEIQEQDNAFLSWTQDGLVYFLTDMGAHIPVDTLAEMANTIILF